MRPSLGIGGTTDLNSQCEVKTVEGEPERKKAEEFRARYSPMERRDYTATR
jgi:hypothetical protein